MSHDYSENILVQESAGQLLERELGWEVAFAYNTEKLGEDGSFGRKSYKEILLTRYFREALLRLNPWITRGQMEEAQKIMESHLSTSSLLQINEEKYFLIRDGIPVTVKKPGGRTETKNAMVIDFQNPGNNHFLAIKELKIHGDLYRRRTDIVGFVNGLPLLFVELKKNTVDVRDAYTNNYIDYLDTIPHLFYYNAFLILSNGTEAKVGTLGSKYEFFHEWKRLSEQEQGSVALETMLRGICKKKNFLDLLENFILYDHSGGHTAKILARNHQYLGVNEAVKAYEGRKLNNGKLGVFWHTQGSGKSYSMVFLAQKIRRKFAGSPTIVVLTDRDELNTQISDTFENCGLLGKTKASQFIASSGDDLIQKLRGNPSFIFTLIQKFNKPEAEPIYPDHDILIMSDEAHRSQYGIFADNMVRLLPTASRIGFTGTPLLSNDNITERTFGGYISVYDFKRAVEDGATVPLYYENRGDKILDIKDNPELTDRILDAIERADLDVDQQDKLEAEFAKEIHILTAASRLEAIARADLIILGPGSLYTSIIPNFLVDGIADAIRRSRAVKALVLNVMTQDGETEGYTASDHVKAILHHAGPNVVDVCVANSRPVPEESLAPYLAEGAEPLRLDREEIMALGVAVREFPLCSSGRYIRHNPDELAKAVLDVWKEFRIH